MASLQSLVLLKPMRLKTGIWVAAYLRRCNVEGVFAAVRRHGAEEAGAIFVKINRLDGTGALYGRPRSPRLTRLSRPSGCSSCLLGAIHRQPKQISRRA
jgi:hypothetical protein